MSTDEHVSRSEKEVFVELESLCLSPGFIHAIAFICMRDNMVMYSGAMTAGDMENLYGRERLIRNEVNVLIGLMVKQDIDFSLPETPTLNYYVRRSQELLEEIHHSMFVPLQASLHTGDDVDDEILTKGAMMREAIFYSGESAYMFQYRDFAPLKYGNDDEWILKNRGFSIANVATIIRALGSLRNNKITAAFHARKKSPSSEWDYLQCHEFTAAELAEITKIPVQTVEVVLSSFSYPEGERNAQFKAVDNRNLAAILPLIRRNDRFVLFNIYDLAETSYQAPYFWMLGDKAYQPMASDHRGKFTEDFSETRLVSVFGRENVKTNINFIRSKNVIGEADVLVLFGDLAIVLQAKSKQLTAAARQGNEAKLQEDFGFAVQEACNQGYSCGQLLLDPSITMEDTSGTILSLPSTIRQIYVICVVADHYPALAYQARQLLKFDQVDKIAAPFVMDVFNLDAMAEMLDTPLRFLSYLDRRANYHETIMSSHELNILGYHLSHNLWLDSEYDGVVIDDDVGTNLEVSMLVRREGVVGPRTPPGILTRLADTRLGKLIREIERQPNPAMLALGFYILQMGEDTVAQLSRSIDSLIQRSMLDGKRHNASVLLKGKKEGLTFHINSDPQDVAERNLTAYCAARKYVQHSDGWFGVLLAPRTGTIKFGIFAESPWVQDAEMDMVTQHMHSLHSVQSRRQMEKIIEPLSKVETLNLGRNALCACGSGKKSKRCCLA